MSFKCPICHGTECHERDCTNKGGRGHAKATRNAAMLEAFIAGRTLGQIAAAHGIKHPTAHKIVKREYMKGGIAR